MPRTARPLTVKEVDAKLTEGLHFVGGVPGLAIAIKGDGGRSWVLRVAVNGKRCEYGLGRAAEVSLAKARQRALELRAQAAEGIDPAEAKRAARSAAMAAKGRARTFAEMADAYIAAKRAGWRSAKHAAQWQSTLATYAMPVLGPMLMQDIATAHVLQVLQPVWERIPETAGRLRNRIELVWGFWDAQQAAPTGINPARWKGHLKALLPNPRSVRKSVSYPAVPVAEAQDFMVKLRNEVGFAARCLELVTLTGGRSAEAFKAQWAEIDLDAGVWAMHASRTKGGRRHRVPLSGPAVAMLKALPRVAGNPYVFPGSKKGRPLSNMAMLMLMRRMGVIGVDGDGVRRPAVPHGLRSTFRDWCAERTAFPRAVIEAAISHKATSDATEAAYLRSDLFDKRIPLMKAWAEFLGSAPASASVRPLRRRA